MYVKIIIKVKLIINMPKAAKIHVKMNYIITFVEINNRKKEVYFKTTSAKEATDKMQYIYRELKKMNCIVNDNPYRSNTETIRFYRDNIGADICEYKLSMKA